MPETGSETHPNSLREINVIAALQPQYFDHESCKKQLSYKPSKQRNHLGFQLQCKSETRGEPGEPEKTAQTTCQEPGEWLLVATAKGGSLQSWLATMWPTGRAFQSGGISFSLALLFFPVDGMWHQNRKRTPNYTTMATLRKPLGCGRRFNSGNNYFFITWCRKNHSSKLFRVSRGPLGIKLFTTLIRMNRRFRNMDHESYKFSIYFTKRSPLRSPISDTYKNQACLWKYAL